MSALWLLKAGVLTNPLNTSSCLHNTNGSKLSLSKSPGTGKYSYEICFFLFQILCKRKHNTVASACKQVKLFLKCLLFFQRLGAFAHALIAASSYKL